MHFESRAGSPCHRGKILSRLERCCEDRVGIGERLVAYEHALDEFPRVVFCLAQSARAQAVGHGVGDFFPDVELPTIDGEQTLRLSSFRGQRLLLIEFASW